MKKNLVLVALLSAMATNAFAVAPDFTTLTAAVDFSTVVTGVMAVAVAIVGVYLAARGARMLLAFVRK